jgi:hypothetical protein
VVPIVWHNYYDRADPIAFRLDRTREWMRKHGWDKAFSFPDENDHEFARYPLPGKAHNDYWDDDRVFGHFLQKVVLRLPDAQVKFDDAAVRKSENLPALTSWLPYLIPFLLLFVGNYLFYSSVHSIVGRRDVLSYYQIFTDVMILTCLLGSITVVARVARLCRKRLLQLGAAALFLGSLGLYAWLATPHLRLALGRPFMPGIKMNDRPAEELIRDLPPLDHLPIDRPTFAVVVVAVLLCVVNYYVCSKWPRAGMKVLMGLGTIVSFVLVGWYVWDQRADAANPLWPVVLAGLAFFYLWWLAAMVFDLIFVWRRYIRKSIALERLEGMIPCQ